MNQRKGTSKQIEELAKRIVPILQALTATACKNKITNGRLQLIKINTDI
jgi:hypothetical protein